MSAQELHAALLRPAILHILRAAGYHSARPSVVDAVSDIAARYMLLLAQRTAYHTWSNHNDPVPTVTDVRMALSDAGLLIPSMTGAEEAWKEVLRKPLSEYPERNGMRMKEARRRDLEDTADVREFIDWVMGPANKEIMRVAGLDVGTGAGKALDVAASANALREDYLTALKKKHSKTGEESRFQGTVLGIPAEDKHVRIEGGPESLHDWIKQTSDKAAAKAESSTNGSGKNGRQKTPEQTPSPLPLTKTEDEDAVMET
ncbi:hypothetical protein IWX49DRAFT_337126 [Phyllosticta citricarpa]|uniref:Bromodomain associated domain-containing protein n=2 Tax=Phyllosticta TaxID=121621 RepID=A0ABR1MC75_9PEZI